MAISLEGTTDQEASPEIIKLRPLFRAIIDQFGLVDANCIWREAQQQEIKIEASRGWPRLNKNYTMKVEYTRTKGKVSGPVVTRTHPNGKVEHQQEDGSFL